MQQDYEIGRSDIVQEILVEPLKQIMRENSEAVEAMAKTGAAVEEEFYDWWAENDHSISLGSSGDVLSLRLRLNAAWANACTSS